MVPSPIYKNAWTICKACVMLETPAAFEPGQVSHKRQGAAVVEFDGAKQA